MEQFNRPRAIGPYMQPLTDVPGALLARASGSVAGYNWLVLLSFPLSAAAAYALARYLALSPLGRRACRDRVCLLAVSSCPRRVPPPHRPDAVDTAVLPRAVALPGQRELEGSRSARRIDRWRDAVEFLRRPDRGGHDPDRDRQLLVLHVPRPFRIASQSGDHDRQPCRRRRQRCCLRAIRGCRRHREPRGVRLRARRPVSLQRQVVGLPRSPGRASAPRWNRGAHLGRRGCDRRAARTTGEPRVGSRGPGLCRDRHVDATPPEPVISHCGSDACGGRVRRTRVFTVA